ncbi:hypothetical protein BX600DRAFT_507566 [Xylariales sp. PMI_506]|nr:hypothetical protein BX600DRAFT_507566 [Xylariales sp. PMI_506]
MPPRRSHKKSRAGCRRCKTRKIKCDEVHPRCGNCVKHGVACDFEHPQLAESLVIPETPGAFQSPSPAFSGSPSPNGGAIYSPMLATAQTALLRQPDPPLMRPTSNRIMELRLLHHYTTVTSKTLMIANPTSEHIYRDTVPNLAFGGAEFLADGILAVSALHLRSLEPNDQTLIRASHAYTASSISAYSNQLSKGINASNAEAMFLASTMIAFQSTASRIFMREDGGDTKDRTGGYAPPISWFYSFQGIKTIVASSWQYLRSSGIVVPIIQSQPVLDLNLSSQESTFFGTLLDGMEDEIRTLETDPLVQERTRQAYQHAVAVLNWSHKIPLTGAPMVFLATVARRYVELLQLRRPRALVILACFFGLMKTLDGIWWLKGIARREIMGILSLFDPDDEEWWPRLQWPVRIAVYDGDIIPAEIWGTDCVPNPYNLPNDPSRSFVSHIELLTQMFQTLQSMPDISADLVAEAAYTNVEGQISAQELLKTQQEQQQQLHTLRDLHNQQQPQPQHRVPYIPKSE